MNSRPRAGTIAAARPFGLQSDWTTVRGCRLHSRSNAAAEARDGLPFLLLHGLVISSLYMIPLGRVIAAAGHEVHALDLPGFGRSEGPRDVLSVADLADWVIDWIAAERISKCHIIGNSLGCEIAAYIAVKAPERVSTVTMIGPTLDPAAFAVFTQTVRLLRDALHEPFSLWLKWMFDFLRAGPRRAFITTCEMFRDPIENQLPHVSARTLVLRGGIDPTVPQSAAIVVARLLPRSQLLVIEGQPHCAHYTAPIAVWRAIENHVRAAATAL